MADRMRIGLIGVGLMGHGIGRNIIEKGYALSVLAHRNRAPVEDLVARGATESTSACELAAGCDLVITCVTGSPQMEAVVYGETGLLAGAHDGLIVVDCTTADPNSTARIVADLGAKGVQFVDAPMTRTPREAEAGKLAVMVGGDTATIDAIRPVLTCFADTVVHAGPVGAGHKLKLVNNFLALGTAAVAAEGICAGRKAGLDMAALEAVVMSGGGSSIMFQRFMRLVIDDDDGHAKFAIANAEKDLRYYADMVRSLPATAPLCAAVHQTYMMACTMGRRDDFVPRLIDLYGDINSVRVRWPE